jgi:hypothetical protein
VPQLFIDNLQRNLDDWKREELRESAPPIPVPRGPPGKAVLPPLQPISRPKSKMLAGGRVKPL